MSAKNRQYMVIAFYFIIWYKYVSPFSLTTRWSCNDYCWFLARMSSSVFSSTCVRITAWTAVVDTTGICRRGHHLQAIHCQPRRRTSRLEVERVQLRCTVHPHGFFEPVSIWYCVRSSRWAELHCNLVWDDAYWSFVYRCLICGLWGGCFRVLALFCWCRRWFLNSDTLIFFGIRTRPPDSKAGGQLLGIIRIWINKDFLMIWR